jgi:hypothetical protein
MDSEFGFRRSILSILRSISQGIESINHKYRAKDNTQEPPPQPNIQVSIGCPPAVTEYYKAENANSKKYNRRDSIRLGLEVVGLGAVLLGGWYAYRTFCEVRRQANYAQGQLETMQKQFEATDRPWIAVEITANTDWVPGSVVGGPLFFDQAGVGHMAAKITLKNIGRSVASHAYIRETVFAVGLDPAELQRPPMEQKKLCSGPNPYTKPGAQMKIDPRFTIFPNDTQVEWESIGFPTAQIPEAELGRPLRNGKPVEPFLVGCVDYEYAASKVPRQTGFIYQVFGSKNHQGIQTLMVIPADKLTFEPWAFGGKYAN